MFTIRNQGPGSSGAFKWRMTCQPDPNQAASCATTWKPSENAGPLTVCPGFVSLSSPEGVVTGQAARQAYTQSLSKPFKAGCRYRVNLAVDASSQVEESNESNNQAYYIAIGP